MIEIHNFSISHFLSPIFHVSLEEREGRIYSKFKMENSKEVRSFLSEQEIEYSFYEEDSAKLTKGYLFEGFLALLQQLFEKKFISKSLISKIAGFYRVSERISEDAEHEKKGVVEHETIKVFYQDAKPVKKIILFESNLRKENFLKIYFYSLEGYKKSIEKQLRFVPYELGKDDRDYVLEVYAEPQTTLRYFSDAVNSLATVSHISSQLQEEILKEIVKQFSTEKVIECITGLVKKEPASWGIFGASSAAEANFFLPTPGSH